MDCPPADTLEALVQGRLPPHEQRRVSQHLQQCDSCRRSANNACPPTILPSEEGAPQPALYQGPLRPGQTLGSHRIVRRIEAGGMGVVYEAVHERLNRRAAVKVLLSGYARDRVQARRFLNEARAPNLVDHPNVVQIYEIGQLQDGTDYILMEYLDGEPLSRRGRDLAQLMRLSVQIAGTLATAHDAGIVHRDLKPGNILIVRDPLVPGGERAKILDFGLAKLAEWQRTDQGWSLDTPEESMLGTPRYMAPEQCGGATHVGGQADVYALGVMLYELLAGCPPFQAAHFGMLMAMHLRDEPPPLQAQRPDLSPQLLGLVHEMLAKDPAQRPTMAQVEERLTALAPAPASLSRQTRRPRPRWLPWTGAGLSLGLVLATALGLWVRGRTPVRVYFHGGTFQMGSDAARIQSALTWCMGLGIPEDCALEKFEREQPARQVRISPFSLDATEVTNEAFASWLNRQPQVKLWHDRQVYLEPTDGPRVLLADIALSEGHGGLVYRGGRYEARQGYTRKPVTQVTWDGALAYCQARGLRLPTEAEWEYAARGAGETTFPWGEETPRCDGVVFGRGKGRACQVLSYGPALVGSAPQDRSPQGVMDLGGNVSEWVMDRFVDRYPSCAAPCVDPVVRGGATKDGRVARGGDWFLPAPFCRATMRTRLNHGELGGNIGFRCAGPSPK